tara:strand:- start:170 stop:1210 length:1041 start_codon:yes stop_codon:yes gene_type:complete
MGSKPKTSQQQGKKGIFGMGPGQSQAMAGNTGLAGISEKQAKSIIDTNKQLNKTFNNNRPSTYMSLGQEIGEVGSKYRRPADAEKYAAEMQTIAEGLAAGATPFIGPDEVARLNFNNLGIKDDQGRTILSKQLPGINARPPTLGEAGGDVARAFTGYNSLQYTDPTSNIPEMVRSPGLTEALIPGQTAARIAKDLYGTAKNFLFPIEEEEEEEFQSLIPRDITIDERVSTPISEKGDTFAYPMGTPTRSFYERPTPPVTIMPNMPGGTGNATNNQQQDTDPDTTPDTTPDEMSEYELMSRRYLEMAGFTQQQIDEIMASQGYAAGGLIPPEKGPMSAGVASLFKNK